MRTQKTQRWQTTFLAALLFAGIARAGEEVKQENHPQVSNKAIDIYWTDNAPVVDGKMDDACWKDAAVARDFLIVITAPKPASEQTEVSVCYDATHLYLFWKAFESQMDKLDPGPALDRHDTVSTREAVFLMLDPLFRRNGEYFGFFASPLGAHKDMGGKKGILFECNWRVAGGRFDKGWTMEMAIPFAELSGDSLPYHATPQAGDTWGINFNRFQSAKSEDSQWSQTGGGMGNWGCIARVFFKGRRQGAPLPKVELLAPEPLYFGPGELTFKITGAVDQVATSFLLSRNGQTEAEEKDKSQASGEWKLPYTIGKAGQWRLQVALSSGGKPFYVVRGEAELPAVAETVDEVRKAVSVATEKLGALDHPAAPGLRKSFAELQNELKATEAWSGRTDKLTREEWRAFAQATEALRAKWKAASFDANLLRLYRPGQAFTVGTARPEEKIYPYTIYDGPIEGPIEVAAAGNEYESFQLVVLPFWQDLHNLSIAFTDLHGPQGIISAGNLSWSRVMYVMYVRMPTNCPTTWDAHAREPDILWPGEPFVAPAGAAQPVWIDVYVPKGTPAGTYEGTIVVKTDGLEVKRPLKVRAYGFDLPDDNSLSMNHWFNWGGWSYAIGAYYGYKIAYTPALWERHVRTLARYRAQQFYIHEFATPTPAYLEPDGHFTFDFSGYDEYIRISKKYHANNLWLSMNGPYPDETIAPFANRNALVIERKTGKRMKMEPFIADWQKRFKENKAYWNDNPVYVDFVKGLVDYLRRMDVLDHTTCELWDEPYTSEQRWLDMVRHLTCLKTIVPELKMLNLAVNPTQVIGGKSAIGVIDIWGPIIIQCDDAAVLAALRERREKHGEPFWFYTASSWQGPGGGYTPHHFYHASYLQPRMHGWMAWWLGADGFLTYCLTDPVGDIDKNFKANPAERWPNSEWYSAPPNEGDGYNLVYPGPEPDCEIIPSMRLASLRDGVEDYEYFILLKKKAAGLDPKKDRKLLAAIQSELQVEPEIISSVYDYAKDSRILYEKRERLARLIMRK